VRRRLERGEFVSGVDYVRAQRVRAKLAGELTAAADGCDALLLPTCGTTAYPLGARSVTCGDHEEQASSFVTRWTPLFSLAGWPAVSVPWKLDREGLPIGIQVCARPYADALALRVAAACERLAGFPARVPDG
jgi:aspartyl-tRNA(Asn)/glutamyl-tRNA(Gln) amidotransferase subunit A